MGLSRADWITIAVTLLLFGLAYYVSGAKAAFICLSLGAGILVLMMFFKREKKQAPAPAPSQSLHQTASPTITQSPTQNITFNVDTHAKEPPPPATPAAPVALMSAPKLESNVRFVGTRWIDADSDETTLYETPAPSALRLAVACFRNDGILGQRIHQPDIEAHIIYKDSAGLEIADVPRAAWMQTPEDHIEFAIAQKRCLVLLLLTAEGAFRRLWREAHYHEHSWMAGGPSYDLNDAEIKERIARIEITLLSEGKGVAIMQTVLDLQYGEEGELPKLKLRS